MTICRHANSQDEFQYYVKIHFFNFVESADKYMTWLEENVGKQTNTWAFDCLNSEGAWAINFVKFEDAALFALTWL